MSISIFNIVADSDLKEVRAEYVEELEQSHAQLRSKLPNKVDEIVAYMTNPNSDIYKYRYVQKSVFDLAVAAINAAIDKAYELEANGLEVPDRLRPFLFEGYSTARLTSICYKLCAIIPLLLKSRGQYNYERYLKLTDEESRKEHPYEQVTFLPSYELKRICGEHSASDYITIKTALEVSGLAYEISDKWTFALEYYDEITECWIKRGEGIAKAIFISKDLINACSEMGDVIAIPSAGIFDSVIEDFKTLPIQYLIPVYNILRFQVSNNLYKAALERLQKGIIRELKEDADDNDPYRYIYRNSISINVKEGNHLVPTHISLQSAHIAVSIHNFDVLTLIKYTIDTYSQRLHTCITRFSKELRRHLRFNYKVLADSDVQSCQPVIFSNLLAEYGYPELAIASRDKDFYQFLKFLRIRSKSEYPISYYKCEFESPQERKKYKEYFMLACYSTGRQFRDFCELISLLVAEEKRPAFIQLLNDLSNGQSELNKQEGFTTETRTKILPNGYEDFDYLPSALPLRMQKTEVDIMFGEDGVCQRLIEAGYTQFTTIHDAIVAVEEDILPINEIMHDAFIEKLNCRKHNSNVTVKTEQLTDPLSDSNLEFD